MENARINPFAEWRGGMGAASLTHSWDALGIPQPAYPIPTSEVLKLMAALEYDCNADTIKGLSRRNILAPQKIGAAFAWTADDLWRLVLELNFQRKWLPLSRYHEAKRTWFERCHEFAAVGDVEKAAGLRSVREIITLLLNSPQSEAGEFAAAVLAHKLQSQGVNLDA